MDPEHQCIAMLDEYHEDSIEKEVEYIIIKQRDQFPVNGSTLLLSHVRSHESMKINKHLLALEISFPNCSGC